MSRYTIMSVEDGNSYHATFDDIKLARKKRDLLKKKGVKRWLLLEEGDGFTRELERGEGISD